MFLDEEIRTVEITNVLIKLAHQPKDRLLAFVSFTLDRVFVVHDAKVIEGDKGLFVAMPNRSISERCAACNGKNSVRAKYCQYCGQERPSKPPVGTRDFVDVAHPIETTFRKKLNSVILDAFQKERLAVQTNEGTS